jgi:hypothetical protein
VLFDGLFVPAAGALDLNGIEPDGGGSIIPGLDIAPTPSASSSAGDTAGAFTVAASITPNQDLAMDALAEDCLGPLATTDWDDGLRIDATETALTDPGNYEIRSVDADSIRVQGNGLIVGPAR